MTMPADIRAFSELQTKYPTAEEAVVAADAQGVTWPYRGLFQLPNVHGSLVHIWSPHPIETLKAVCGWEPK